MVTRRPMWEKAILVAGSFPIALAANMVRITATGVLHETAGPSVANAVFHDLSGWLMMPLALGMLWLVQQILANLFVEPAAARPIPIHLAGADAARPTRPGSAGAGHGPEGLPRP
jgi:exosortase/archaeosortase family protein